MDARKPALARIALSLIALSLAGALAAGCREAPAAPSPGAAAAGDDISHFTCSMHPSVKNAEPGSCPLCNMALMPVRQRERDSGEVVLDAGRRQQIGITVARAERRPLTAPVRAAGAVTYDQSRLTDVTLRVGGWVDELYADRLGQRVEEGEPLFTLYSPDLFEAQQEYLDSVEKLEKARMLSSPLSDDLLIETRRRRLRLADLGTTQLDRLDQRGLPVELVEILAPASGHVIEKNLVAGAAVSPGMRLLRIAGLDRVWVEVEVYESELGLLEVGDRATVTLPHLPGRSFAGRIGFVYPWLDGETRTGRVRIELPNRGLALKPEMYAEVVFEPDLGERLAVPEEAVLHAGDGRYVFVDLGGGRLRPQAVSLGQRAGEWVEVLDGLAEGDEVVTSGNFLVAAEARLKLALDHWTPAGSNGRAPAEAAPDHGEVAHAAHAVEAGDRDRAAEPERVDGAGAGHPDAHDTPAGGGHDSPADGHHGGHDHPAAAGADGSHAGQPAAGQAATGPEGHADAGHDGHADHGDHAGHGDHAAPEPDPAPAHPGHRH